MKVSWIVKEAHFVAVPPEGVERYKAVLYSPRLGTVQADLIEQALSMRKAARVERVRHNLRALEIPREEMNKTWTVYFFDNAPRWASGLQAVSVAQMYIDRAIQLIDCLHIATGDIRAQLRGVKGGHVVLTAVGGRWEVREAKGTDDKGLHFHRQYLRFMTGDRVATHLVVEPIPSDYAALVYAVDAMHEMRSVCYVRMIQERGGEIRR